MDMTNAMVATAIGLLRCGFGEPLILVQIIERQWAYGRCLQGPCSMSSVCRVVYISHACQVSDQQMQTQSKSWESFSSYSPELNHQRVIATVIILCLLQLLRYIYDTLDDRYGLQQNQQRCSDTYYHCDRLRQRRFPAYSQLKSSPSLTLMHR